MSIYYPCPVFPAASPAPLGRIPFEALHALLDARDLIQLPPLHIRHKGIDPRSDIPYLVRALARCRDAWLAMHGHVPAASDTEWGLWAAFEGQAPPALRAKFHVLDTKLRFLADHVPKEPATRDPGSKGRQEWDPEALACVTEIKALADSLEHGTALPPFRWESPGGYRPGQWVETHRGFEAHPQAAPWHRRVLATDERSVILWDPINRTIERRSADDPLLSLADLPEDDMTTPIQRRRAWFDLHPEYRQVPLVVFQGMEADHSHYYTCPCCGYPTHTHNGSIDLDDGIFRYEICPICDWANKNDAHIPSEWSPRQPDAANAGYSLAEAQAHFEEHGSIYQPTDGIYYEYNTNDTIRMLKQTLRSHFDAMIGDTGQGRLYLHWQEAEQARTALLKELRHFEEQHAGAFTTRREDSDVVGRQYEFKWETWGPSSQPGRWYMDAEGTLWLLLWLADTGTGYVSVFRSVKREIRNASLWSLTPTDWTVDDMRTPQAVRRVWFDVHPEYLRGHVTCPCCGFPTLSGYLSREECRLCRWVDNGQDEHNAGRNLGAGPDPSYYVYPLTNARKNFEETGRCFFEDTWIGPAADKKKRALMDRYYDLIRCTSDAEAATIWGQLESLFRRW